MLDSEVWEIGVNGNEIWLARGRGIEMFNTKTGKWTPYLSILYGEHRALSILPSDSIVWVGTEGGLVKFDRDLNRWVTFTTDDGLPHNRVEHIEIEGDYLWLATPGGLCRFYWNDPYRLD